VLGAMDKGIRHDLRFSLPGSSRIAGSQTARPVSPAPDLATPLGFSRWLAFQRIGLLLGPPGSGSQSAPACAPIWDKKRLQRGEMRAKAGPSARLRGLNRKPAIGFPPMLYRRALPDFRERAEGAQLGNSRRQARMPRAARPVQLTRSR